MTSTIIRWFFFLLFCLVLSGCALPVVEREDRAKTPDRKDVSTTDETRLFSQGLDEYFTSGDLTTLKLLPQKYPQGEWRRKTEHFLALVKKQRVQQSRLKKREMELAGYKKEKETLVADKELLEGTLKRLKEALIDTELRAK